MNIHVSNDEALSLSLCISERLSDLMGGSGEIFDGEEESLVSIQSRLQRGIDRWASRTQARNAYMNRGVS